jgi:hypothetical protein
VGQLIQFAIRVVCLIAMFIVWGWWAPLIALVLLTFIQIPKTSWGTYDLDSGGAFLRVSLEIGILVLGLIAINQAWGEVWVATTVVVWVISSVAK